MKNLAHGRVAEVMTDVVGTFKRAAESDHEFRAGCLFIFASVVAELTKLMSHTGGNVDALSKQGREDVELYCTLYAYNLLRAIDDVRNGAPQVEDNAAEMFQKLTGRVYPVDKGYN
jgi:hypothetical protein